MRYLSTMLLVLLAVGIHAAEFNGTWGIDTGKFIDQLKAAQGYDAAEAEGKAMMDQVFTEMMSQMAKATFTISDEALVVTGGSKDEKVTIIKKDVVEKVMTVTIKDDEEEQTVTFTLVDDDHMQMQVAGQEMAMWLVRKPAGEVVPVMETPAEETPVVPEVEAP